MEHPEKLAMPELLVVTVVPPVHDSAAPAVPVPLWIDRAMGSPATVVPSESVTWTMGWMAHTWLTPPALPVEPPGCVVKVADVAFSVHEMLTAPAQPSRPLPELEAPSPGLVPTAVAVQVAEAPFRLVKLGTETLGATHEEPAPPPPAPYQFPMHSV